MAVWMIELWKKASFQSFCWKHSGNSSKEDSMRRWMSWGAISCWAWLEYCLIKIFSKMIAIALSLPLYGSCCIPAILIIKIKQLRRQVWNNFDFCIASADWLPFGVWDVCISWNRKARIKAPVLAIFLYDCWKYGSSCSFLGCHSSATNIEYLKSSSSLQSQFFRDILSHYWAAKVSATQQMLMSAYKVNTFAFCSVLSFFWLKPPNESKRCW